MKRSFLGYMASGHEVICSLVKHLYYKMPVAWQRYPISSEEDAI